MPLKLLKGEVNSDTLVWIAKIIIVLLIIVMIFTIVAGATSESTKTFGVFSDCRKCLSAYGISHCIPICIII